MHCMEREARITCKQCYSVSEAAKIKLKMEGYAEMPSLFPELEELSEYVI